LPYVDLVDEILESRVIGLGKGVPSAALVPQATTATAPELLANPEYLNPQAYTEHLGRTVFPHILPFDLWGELGRVYFEHLGVRRSDLMEALRRPGAPNGPAIEAERLALSAAQWQILLADDDNVWQCWGYRSQTPDGKDFKLDLANVSTFLQRSNLEYDQLL